jgi:electron transfer flavoprotein alpha subunit
MNKTIHVIVEHKDGIVADVTLEMLGKAAELADQDGKVVAVACGYSLGGLIGMLEAATEVLLVEDERLTQFSPVAHAAALASALGSRDAGPILIAASSGGLDLASLLAAALERPLIGNCRDILAEGDALVAVSQLYGGKMMAEVPVPEPSTLLNILPGSFPVEHGRTSGTPVVTTVTLTDIDQRIRFVQWIAPPAGDVDVTAMPVLVSVGRGIQNKDNIEAAEELAAALGGAVSASRPVVDQGWLPLTRQIGRSGMIVKPKLYLACGISGAPEHLEGMRDAELIIAINTDPNAPIFSAAHYGVVGDALDYLPALTDAVHAVTA